MSDTVTPLSLSAWGDFVAWIESSIVSILD